MDDDRCTAHEDLYSEEWDQYMEAMREDSHEEVV